METIVLNSVTPGDCLECGKDDLWEQVNGEIICECSKCPDCGRYSNHEYYCKESKSYKDAKRDVEVRVERSAKILDEKDPDWYKGVKLDILRMSSVQHCVLGQMGFQEKWGNLEEGYYPMMEKLGLHSEEHMLAFSAKGDMPSSMEYALLDELWSIEVIRRKYANKGV